uniref:Uncharacterized protein n=1 Tax=Zea mays TaxID=4577 RepID=A0A804LKR7_MAIZE
MPSSHGRPGSPWLSFLPAGSPQIAPGLFPLVENTSALNPPLLMVDVSSSMVPRSPSPCPCSLFSSRQPWCVVRLGETSGVGGRRARSSKGNARRVLGGTSQPEVVVDLSDSRRFSCGGLWWNAR